MQHPMQPIIDEFGRTNVEEQHLQQSLAVEQRETPAQHKMALLIKVRPPGIILIQKQVQAQGMLATIK